MQRKPLKGRRLRFSIFTPIWNGGVRAQSACVLLIAFCAFGDFGVNVQGTETVDLLQLNLEDLGQIKVQ